MSPSARKIHVGIVAASRTPRRIDPEAGLPRLKRIVVPTEVLLAQCPCGSPCHLCRDRNELTWLECVDCGAANRSTRQAAIG